MPVRFRKQVVFKPEPKEIKLIFTNSVDSLYFLRSVAVELSFLYFVVYYREPATETGINRERIISVTMTRGKRSIFWSFQTFGSSFCGKHGTVGLQYDQCGE